MRKSTSSFCGLQISRCLFVFFLSFCLVLGLLPNFAFAGVSISNVGTISVNDDVAPSDAEANDDLIFEKSDTCSSNKEQNDSSSKDNFEDINDGEDNVSSADSDQSTFCDEQNVNIADNAIESQATNALTPASRFDTAFGSEVNHHQLVLLVRFAGDKTGDGSTGFNEGFDYDSEFRTQWEYFIDQLNGRNATVQASRSFYEYISKISNNKIQVVSEFPQTDTNTGKVAYLDLPKTRSEYNNHASIVSDAVSVFNASYPSYDASKDDGDKDSYIDNVLVVPVLSTAPVSQEDPCWPRQAGLYGQGVSIGTGSAKKNVGSYTLIGTTNVESVGTVAHEFLHTLGAKDLYRANSTSEPVGLWDIMAKNYPTRFQWPLAITREDIGWSTTASTVSNLNAQDNPDGTKSATYTLYAPESNKQQSLKIKTPFSNSEYFMVEYRQKGEHYYGSLDNLLDGSGLIAYRVNPSYKGVGNRDSKDYVYVFRPGETNTTEAFRGDGGGEIEKAYISANTGSARASMGNSDFSKGLTDGALTYSNGQNSGLVISAMSQTEDSITFKITYPDYAAAGAWQEAVDNSGKSPLPQNNVLNTSSVSGLLDGKTVTYVLSQTGTFQNANTTVHCFDGVNWRNLNSPASGLSANASLYYLNNVLYVLSTKTERSSNQVCLHSYQNGQWVQIASVGLGSSYSNYLTMGSVGNNLYVAVDKDSKQIQLYKLNLSGKNLEAQGNPLTASNVARMSLGELNGDPALVFGDMDAKSSSTKVALWRNNAWNTNTLASECAQICKFIQGNSKTDAESDQGAIIVALFNGKTTLFEVDEKGSFLGSHALNMSGVTDVSAVRDFDNLYIAVASSSGTSTQTAIVYSANVDSLSKWEQLGSNVVAPSGIVSLSCSNSDIYCLSSDFNSVTLRKYAALETGNPDNPTVIALPKAQSGLVYNGSDQIGVKENRAYTLTGVYRATKAGSYTAFVTPKEGYQWNAQGDKSTKSMSWSIGRASLSSASISGVNASYTFNNSNISPNPVVKIGSTTLVKDRDYTVAYKNNRNVGTATLTITGIGNYTGSKSVNYKIVAPTANLYYQAHVSNIGWQNEVSAGKTAGTEGRNLQVEAFKLRLASSYSGNIQVQAHVRNIGWQNWVNSGAVSGTTGRALAIEALRIRLTGDVSNYFDVYYRTHCQNVGWTGWAKNGESSGTAGYAYHMEAVQIQLVPKGGAAPGSTNNAFIQARLLYQAHVSNIGWQSSVRDGATAGTTGRALQVEAFKVQLQNQPYSGSIQVKSHVKNIGWQNWVNSGVVSGTTGRNLWIEALQIRLTGEMANKYDIYYRTHCANVGWTGWAKNGESCGTAGFAYRMEAAQIKLVPKGAAAPGSTANHFYQR